LGKVHVFLPPKPSPRGLLLKKENTTRELLALADFNSEHPKAFSRYFELFYSRVNDTGGRFKELLHKDSPHVHFRTAGSEFRLIDDQAQQPVFVRFGNSGRWLDELRPIGPKLHTLRKLQRYTVNISKKDFEKAKTDGLLEEIWRGYWLWIGRYDLSYGLDLYSAGWAPEDLMV
jgi:CRISPR-associated endonuclease/helicase Cas3